MTARPAATGFGLVVGALALFGLGTNVQAGWLITLAAVLLGMALAGGVLAYGSTAHITVTRDCPARLVAGDPVPIGLRITNTGRRARWSIGASDDFLGEAGAFVAALGPGETRVAATLRNGARRGVWETGICTLSSGAPFGVLSTTRRVPVASPVTVHPRTRLLDLAQLLTALRDAPIGDLVSVREFQAGDSPRLIHWRASAHRDQLVVRIAEADAEPSTIAIHTDSCADADQLDAIAETACSVGLAALAAGFRVLTAVDGAYRAVDSDLALLDWGARLGPGAGGPPPAPAVRDLTVIAVGPTGPRVVAIDR